MSDLIIKIGDDALDLNADETIAITKQASKVGDFSTVLANGTNEVTVPLTPNNQSIMDNAHLIPSDSAKPYGRLDATLIQDGYETLQDGYAIIKSSANNYSVQVVGGNATFFSKVKDANLRDLELSDFEHFWTNQNAFDLRNESEGLIYSVFEQSGGNDPDQTMRTYSSTPNNRYAVETRLLLPSIYIKTLVERIFSEQGYTFESDLIGEDIYDKAVVFRGKVPNRGSDMSYHECTVRNESSQLVDFLDPISYGLFEDASIDANDSSYTPNPLLLDSIESNARKFLLTDSCTVTLDVRLEIQNNLSAKDVRIAVIHSTPDGQTTTNSNEVTIVNGTSTNDFTVTFDCSMNDSSVFFIPAIEYVVPSAEEMTMLADSTYTVSNVELISNAGITSEFPFNYLTGVTMVDEMKQGTFLQELAKAYQWIFDTNEITKVVTAHRFGKVKDNIPNAIDLSDKIDANSIKIKYGVDGFAQSNALKYKEDNVTKYDAIGYIDVDDTTLKAEKDYVKMSHFAATSTRVRFGNVNAPYTPLFEDSLPTNGLTSRIFLVRRTTPFYENVNFARAGSSPENHPTDDLTFAYFAEAGNEDSLDFPTLISRFYQPVVDMTERGKTVECKVDLNIKDVMNYDPLTPVYISSMGNYFYWEKLSNYVKGKLTKCKFVKV